MTIQRFIVLAALAIALSPAGCVPSSIQDCGNGRLCRPGTECSGDGTTCVTAGGCSNAILDASEECDDGDLQNGDGCDSNCTVTACGNGILTAGETCDDGNAVNGDGCDNNCKPTGCGNGIPTSGEECDDGNMDNADACLNSCVVARCGDGFVHTGVEGCDDGNTNNTDACLNSCVVARCGDGVIYPEEEECDDGNTDNTDGCMNSCTTCSDGDAHIADPTTGRCFTFYTTLKTYAQARSFCHSLIPSASLASVRNDLENAQIAALVGSIPAFLGGTDAAAENTFRWDDGTPFNYTNWKADAPNNGDGGPEEDCMVIMGWNSGGKWNDVPCAYTPSHTEPGLYPFVCEQD